MEQPLTRAEVPGMLVAALGLATAGSGRLAPAHLRTSDVKIVSEYIGAADVERQPYGSAWKWKCPACGAWEFGPTLPIEEAVQTWLHGGRLPPGALLAGVCLACEHTTDPTGLDIVDPDDVADYLKTNGSWPMYPLPHTTTP
ncbi:hypothetical protein [Streptomyces bottropensis]|uniref:hypothetical protein n=1 Tax=Streptomyces bottropensis TaxID=42235 RepID=UPI0036C52D6F